MMTKKAGVSDVWKAQSKRTIPVDCINKECCVLAMGLRREEEHIKDTLQRSLNDKAAIRLTKLLFQLPHTCTYSFFGAFT